MPWTPTNSTSLRPRSCPDTSPGTRTISRCRYGGPSMSPPPAPTVRDCSWPAITATTTPGRHQRHRHLGAPVLAALPRSSHLHQPPAAHRRLPRCRGVSRAARPRRRLRYLRGAAARRDLPGHRHHLGVPAPTGVQPSPVLDRRRTCRRGRRGTTRTSRSATGQCGQRDRADAHPRPARGPRPRCTAPTADVQPHHPHRVAWDTGHAASVDVILWCTGFRSSLDHLAPLHLRDFGGDIRMTGRLATQVTDEPHLHLLGYGPSTSTIGANRAGRAAVQEIDELLRNCP